jgi:hypothetical protein
VCALGFLKVSVLRVISTTGRHCPLRTSVKHVVTIDCCRHLLLSSLLVMHHWIVVLRV